MNIRRSLTYSKATRFGAVAEMAAGSDLCRSGNVEEGNSRGGDDEL